MDNIEEISADIRKKEEILRQLRLVRHYHDKHNLADLDRLYQNWYRACQSIAQDLYENVSKSPQVVSTEGSKKPSMEDMLKYFGIDCVMIGYDTATESFRDS